MRNNQKKIFNPKFSFVIPIYNVEAYLAETVESILAQSMDFEQNCEIIFVNDGSPDNSEAICLHYKERFPENVQYIKKENGGLSAARNTGIAAVKGKYVSFIDPDDKLSPDTAEKVYDFFEKHYDEIDVATIKVQMFEARTDEHILNYRFHTSRVIDVEKESDQIQLHAASAFVKAEALKAHQFDARIRKFAEDLKFMTELILDKMAYGVVSDAMYLYRKREAGGSIMDSERSSRVWYTDIPKLVHLSLFEYSKQKLGYVPKYVQHVVMHDLQWRFRQPKQHVLNDEEIKTYKELVISIVKQVDDEVIIAQKHMLPEFKFFALTKKYPDKPVMTNATRKGLVYSYRGLEIYDCYEHNPSLHISVMTHKQHSVVLEGYFNGFLFAGSALKFKVGQKWYEVEKVERPNFGIYFFDELVYDRNSFRVELPLEAGKNVVAYIAAGDDKKPLKLVPHRQTGFSAESNHSYRTFADCVVVIGRYEIFVQPKTWIRLMRKELRRLVDILSRRRFANAWLRLLGLISKMFTKKKVWLLMDRPKAAGDNAEALFEYVVAQQNKSIKPFFVVARTSADYVRMAQIGRIIEPGSFRYKLLFLVADKVISSHADDFITNPFGKQVTDFVDLFDFDFVFLQHGIIHNNLSGWLNRYSKNIKLFVTSAVPEYNSLLEEDYGYDKDVVCLTGLPRYDYLENHEKHKLIIMPTWRRKLEGPVDKVKGVRQYNEEFTRSEYFAFYQKLIKDERLHKALQQSNMTGEFYLHPSLAAQIKDFEENDTIQVMSMPYDYRKAFSEGSVMVTDYSSVAFDFAYLKKPLVYAQFDKEKFYTEHHWDPGYFSYESNGFGPVVYDYEATIQEVIKLIDTNCEMPAKYKQRVEKFFYKFDKKNSERVYRAILNMRK